MILHMRKLVISQQNRKKMDEELLITEVEKYPIICDNTYPFYKYAVMKENAWSAILTRVGVVGDS